jgi:protein-L-isoaspartate(D-aspartate) O-methyltransferase
MVLEENEELIEHLKSLGALKSRSLEEAIRKFPRHLFVPEFLRHVAYEDTPLRIGHNQTISQPLTVVIMTEALNVQKGDKVLEVGTGSGWQASLISYLVGERGYVYTVEIVEDLYKTAKKNMKTAKTKNVKPILGDGSIGLEKESPFDGVIVTAAAPRIPETLLEQLKVGGIMVIPVGDMMLQELFVIRKNKNIEKTSLGEFAFVPLLGKYGFR